MAISSELGIFKTKNLFLLACICFVTISRFQVNADPIIRLQYLKGIAIRCGDYSSSSSGSSTAPSGASGTGGASGGTSQSSKPQTYQKFIKDMLNIPNADAPVLPRYKLGCPQPFFLLNYIQESLMLYPEIAFYRDEIKD